MPPAPASPDRLLALGTALAPLRDGARTGADEVLGLYPEVGDRAAQACVEACLDQVVDVLRALDEATSELGDRLRIAASTTADDIGADDRTPGLDTTAVLGSRGRRR
jgi:hypothetical protein